MLAVHLLVPFLLLASVDSALYELFQVPLKCGHSSYLANDFTVQYTTVTLKLAHYYYRQYVRIEVPTTFLKRQLKMFLFRLSKCRD